MPTQRAIRPRHGARRLAGVRSMHRGRHIAVLRGGMAGAVAGMAMASWAMAAGAFTGIGVFTPLYLMASPFVGTGEAIRSLAFAGAGDPGHWASDAAPAGAGVHLLTSVALGMLFGAVARAVQPRGVLAVTLGAAYGLLVLGAMHLVVQPATHDLFGGGRYVEDIGGILGWPAWAGAHLAFGIVLGLWPARRPQDVAREQGLLDFA